MAAVIKAYKARIEDDIHRLGTFDVPVADEITIISQLCQQVFGVIESLSKMKRP